MSFTKDDWVQLIVALIGAGGLVIAALVAALVSPQLISGIRNIITAIINKIGAKVGKLSIAILALILIVFLISKYKGPPPDLPGLEFGTPDDYVDVEGQNFGYEIFSPATLQGYRAG